MKPTRRELGLSALAFAGLSRLSAASAGYLQDDANGFKLGVASYSLRNFSRSGAIKALKALHVKYVNVKDTHLSMNATPDEIKTARRDFDKEHIQILGCGNVSFRKRTGTKPDPMPKDADGEDADPRPEVSVDEQEMRRNFEYAKALGAPLMVMAPTHDNLEAIEKYAREYNIKCAIHNHGPEDKLFASPQDVLKYVKNMSPLMGLCIDVGHTARTGADVVESIREAGPRLLDMHIKDLADFHKKKSQVPVGEGQMPVVEIFKQLEKMKYTGGVMLEYEVDEEAPVPGMQRSFSYMRGVLNGMKG